MKQSDKFSETAFSVLIPIYIKENPTYLDICLDSIYRQTLKPAEVVIVEDGPINQPLDGILLKWQRLLPLKRYKLQENKGLGVALNHGVAQCQNSIIARMDADDYADKNRFKKQIQYLKTHPNIDIVGSWIMEFDHDLDDITGERRLPEASKVIERFAKSRNPLNHMTVVFRKQAVVNAGNYVKQDGFEDYYLWVRLIQNGSKLANIQEPLVFARMGNGLIARRIGFKYFINELSFQFKIFKLGYTNIFELFRNILTRAFVRLIPPSLMGILYKNFLRKSFS